MTSIHQQALLAAIVVVTLTACGGTTEPLAPESPPSATTASPSPAPESEEDAGAEDNFTLASVDNHPPHDELDQDILTAVAEASARFIAGWTTLDRVERSQVLEPVASLDLFEMFTDPRFQPINAKPSGPIHIHVDGFQAVARQRLDDSTTAQVVLVIDPTTESGWTVIDIEHA